LGFYDQLRLAHRGRKVAKKSRRSGASPLQRASTRHDIWAIDFMSDQCVSGQRFRLLVVFDEYSRELLAFRVARAFRSADVVKVLDEVRREQGRGPNYLRSDNGPEFIAEDLASW
jgi:transposase InsO family protein